VRPDVQPLHDRRPAVETGSGNAAGGNVVYQCDKRGVWFAVRGADDGFVRLATVTQLRGKAAFVFDQ
jgi:hypothetical protein